MQKSTSLYPANLRIISHNSHVATRSKPLDGKIGSVVRSFDLCWQGLRIRQGAVENRFEKRRFCLTGSDSEVDLALEGDGYAVQ
jgi:hypothetical protein